MATPSSGQQISIQDIVNEFGGSAPHGLKEYYTEAGIASGNQIGIKDFYDLSASTAVTFTVTWSGRRFLYSYEIGKSYFEANYHGYVESLVELGTQNTSTSSFGSRSPTTFNGVSVRALGAQLTLFPTFYIIMAGNRPKSFFTTATVEGSLLPLTSASATYTYDSTYNITRWSWADSDPNVAGPFGDTATFTAVWAGTGTNETGTVTIE